MKRLLTLGVLTLALILDVETIYASGAAGYNNYLYEIKKAEKVEIVKTDKADIDKVLEVALRDHR